MKLLTLRHLISLLCLSLWLCPRPGLAQESPSHWLALLNSQPGRERKLTEADVAFRASTSPNYPGLVAAGFPQSDGTYTLGSLIWAGKVWSPLEGYAEILRQTSFAEASDEVRTELFLDLLKQTNGRLGIHPYSGPKSREQNRPQPITGYRQSDGLHRLVVWICEEPGTRDGAEWRRMLYLVNLGSPVAVQSRTLDTFHPEAEGLGGFPPIPSESYE